MLVLAVNVAARVLALGMLFEEDGVMPRLITRLGGGAALGLLILAGAAPVDAENVPLHMMPKPVLDTVRARFKDARITGAAKEREDGTLVYEVTIKQKGQKIDVSLTPEGAIVLIKREIAAADLPEPVTRALEEKYPRATYTAVEEVIKVHRRQERLAHYEVDLVTVQRRLLGVQVSVGGKILKEVK